MNLQEYCDALVNGDLSDKAIKQKWMKFCQKLSELPVEDISHFVYEGFLDQFVDYEANDGFGTEGMNL